MFCVAVLSLEVFLIAGFFVAWSSDAVRLNLEYAAVSTSVPVPVWNSGADHPDLQYVAVLNLVTVLFAGYGLFRHPDAVHLSSEHVLVVSLASLLPAVYVAVWNSGAVHLNFEYAAPSTSAPVLLDPDPAVASMFELLHQIATHPAAA